MFKEHLEHNNFAPSASFLALKDLMLSLRLRSGSFGTWNENKIDIQFKIGHNCKVEKNWNNRQNRRFWKTIDKKTKLEIQKQNAIFSLIKKCHAAMKSARIFVWQSTFLKVSYLWLFADFRQTWKRWEIHNDKKFNKNRS